MKITKSMKGIIVLYVLSFAQSFGFNLHQRSHHSEFRMPVEEGSLHFQNNYLACPFFLYFTNFLQIFLAFILKICLVYWLLHNREIFCVLYFTGNILCVS